MAAETARRFTAANSEYFTIADNASLSLSDGLEYTIGGWFYFVSLPSGGQHLMGKWPTGAGSEYLLWMNSATPTVQAPGVGGSVAWSATLSTATWYFIEAGYDGTNGFINVNRGTRVTGSYSGTNDTGTAFTIGAHTGVGRVANMRAQMMFLYKTTEATSTQLDDHYNSGAGKCYDDLSDTSNMISFWEGNEASGDLVDAHGSNDLTDTNTVTSEAGLVECVGGGGGSVITPQSMLMMGAGL